ncbi:hypothetical protein PHMEG_00010853 [Phytophthora megakarya]|uniref:WLGC domain-containing protein n=1 Tax=Phytophthora megakarya TaxID=4795 RepID=A0A225WCM3_9STRA|nr:hypothetical protein PHMEG_00010853 [Phytophthora megakarya]
MTQRLSGPEALEPRPSIVNVVAAEVATFHDVFGFLGVPMIIVFLVSAAWTFVLAAIQAHADMMANEIMNTTNFDSGEFWLLPKPKPAIIISSVVLLTLFGAGYTALAITMIFFYRSKAVSAAHDTTSNSINKTTNEPITTEKEEGTNLFHRTMVWFHDIPVDVRQHYYTAALDLPKLIFQTVTLYTYLQDGFPVGIIYYYSILLFLNWLVACYRSQHYVNDPDLIIARLYYTFDLFFAVFAPLVVLVYFIHSFKFDRAEFRTKMETLSPSTFDNVARIFGDPSQISSFCSAFHYLQFSSGLTLFYKSALNVLSLYKWRKIVLTLIHNHNERQRERRRKTLVGPVPRDTSHKARFKRTISKTFSRPNLKSKFGKHFVTKLLLSLVFLVWGVFNLVFSIGSVVSTQDVCRKYDKCVVASYQWNFGNEHCTCLVFADRQTKPTTFAEWTDPVDTTTNLAELATAGELRIIQIINRAVPELPEELRKCQALQQLILVYTKTELLPAWLSEFSHLEYLHVEGDFTNRRMRTISDGIFDNMHHLAFMHLGSHPDVEQLPSLSGLSGLRYLTIAVMDSLKEIPSFEGLSTVSHLSIVHAPRVTTLPTLEPLTNIKSVVIRARSAVCCNGFITGSCNMTESQCLPISGEKYPLACTDDRISANDKLTLDSSGSAYICPPSLPLDREATAPSKYSTDTLCGGVLFKECSLNNAQGMCYNTRMMVVNCETTTSFITMRKLQIQRGVGIPCDPNLEAWLGCTKK